MIGEPTRWRGRQYAEVGFVAGVTAVLLALVADGARRGPEGLLEVVAFALAAGFGLEFVGASWQGRWRGPAAPRQLGG